MDFTPTEAQATLGGLTREILAGREAVDGFDRTLWSDVAASGVLSATLPADAGGDGLGFAEQCAILTEIGRTALGLPFLPAIVVAASAVARFGSVAQVSEWAAPAGAGSLVLTASVDLVAARPHGDGWVLDGSLPAVAAAPYADAILVPAPAGAFVVTPSDAGVGIETDRVAGGPGQGAVHLTGVAVGAERLIPIPPDWLRDRFAVGLAATQVGVLERMLELTAEYARARVQFGKPIGSFQAVAQRLADAYIDVEGVRLTTAQAVWRLDSGLDCTTEVATAKFWAADAGHRVAHTCVHVHGGVGIDLDHVVQRYFLAAKYNEFTLGGATEQLLHIGASLATTTPAL